MDIVSTLLSENGIIAAGAGLIGVCIGVMLKWGKYKNVQAKTRKELAAAKSQEEQLQREKAEWEAKTKPAYTATISLEKAKRTYQDGDQTNKLDDRSFFTVKIELTNYSKDTLIIESIRFVGREERSSDHGYGSDVMKTLDVDMLNGHEVALPLDKPTGEYTQNYKIGKNWHSRLNSHAVVVCRVGNHKSYDRIIGQDCRALY